MKPNKILSLLVCAFILVLSSTVSATTVYRWVDEDGIVQFGSKAENEHAKEIKIKVINSSSGRTNQQKKFLKALEEENKSLADEKKKKREQIERVKRNVVRETHSSRTCSSSQKATKLLLGARTRKAKRDSLIPSKIASSALLTVNYVRVFGWFLVF